MGVTRFTTATAAALLLGTAASEPAHAQDGFLFDMPEMSLTLRAGPVMHRAESPVFDFITSELTLDRSDFRAPALGAEVGFVLHPRVDLALGIGWAETETRSEFRDFVEEVPNPDDPDGPLIDVPIEQTTRLRTMPVSVSTRIYPLSRGRAVSSLAWLPARTTPYLGAGIDFNFYRLQQFGDFVATATDYSISTQDYQSSGRATTAHARIGVDHWFSPTVGLNLEGRYTYGTGRLNGDFMQHDRIDLSGAHAGLGLTFRW